MKEMFFFLLLFIVVPIAELYIIIQVAQETGVLNSIGLLILVSLIGAWLVRAEGTGVLKKIRVQLAKGEIPGRELVDGGLILLAGVLMLTPGFLTDAFGLLLLFPLTRPIFRSVLLRKFTMGGSIFGARQGSKDFGFSKNSFGFFKINETEIVDLQRNQDFGETPPKLEND